MPNLNAESKLITPWQAFFYVVFGCFFAVWYWDVDFWYHAGNFKATVLHVLGQ